jgi:hypothetical protein
LPLVLTATRLMELDLPLDWTEQHRLLASKLADSSHAVATTAAGASSQSV